VKDSLDVFERVMENKDDSATAAAVLERLSKVAPSSEEDRVHAAEVTYQARLLSNAPKEKACEALTFVADIAPKTSLKNRVAGDLVNCK
jgi:hypothetical protein